MEKTSVKDGEKGSKSKILLLILLILTFLALYSPVIIPLVSQWLEDPNYRHGILVPIISAIVIFQRRKSIPRPETTNLSLKGPILIAIASILLIGGTAASELFTSRISLPIMILGISFFIAGETFTRSILFPILFLFLMIPLPYIIYYKLTFPFQLLSARLSASALSAIGIEVIRRGNILILPNYTLEVVAACSGLRSLMSMFTLSIIMAAFIDFSKTRKVILVLLSLPAAIAANTVRLAATAIGATLIGPEFAEGTMHNISGLVVFGFGIGFLLIAALVLKWKS